MNSKSSSCFGSNGKPLSEFYSREEAIDQANYVKSRYREDLTPYRCDRCGLWHLGLKSRETKSEPCKLCRDSYGRRKELYYSFESAKRRADILEREKSVRLIVYKCPHQEGWHLTKG